MAALAQWPHWCYLQASGLLDVVSFTGTPFVKTIGRVQTKKAFFAVSF